MGASLVKQPAARMVEGGEGPGGGRDRDQYSLRLWNRVERRVGGSKSGGDAAEVANILNEQDIFGAMVVHGEGEEFVRPAGEIENILMDQEHDKSLHVGQLECSFVQNTSRGQSVDKSGSAIWVKRKEA